MLKLVRAAALAGATLMAAGGVHAETVIRAVMHSPLRLTDPHATTAYITTWHGYMIYDTLLATDANNKVQPQMLEKWEVSDDGKTYTMTLRDGLKWHDGQPVKAEDCVASIKRWAAGDGMGRTLLKFVSSIDVVDDKTFRIVMTEPTDLALRALSKPTGTAAFMMPKRIAEIPVGTPITDMTGSGPFKIAEFKPGVTTVYVKNPDYVPRKEPASALAGGKVVNIDKVVWNVMPDALTTANALMGGEIDYVEQFPYDLLPMLDGNSDFKVESLSPVGYFTMYRFNFKYPPFNNKKIRQAAMYAVGQEDVMKALVGNPKYYQTCASLWGCGTPYESDIGKDMVVPSNIEKAQALLKEAGYDNTPILVMHATDVGTLSPQPVVMAQALRKAGFNVNLAAMDWQTVATRRASKAAPDAGGWNVHNTNWYATDIMDPVRSAPASANGDSAWFGWPDFPEIEALRTKFALTSDPAEQKKIADEVQRIGIEEGLYVPLGQMSVPTAYSVKLSGLVHAPIMAFWNVKKAP
ncbi:ABC transporter substrate-binding protein [Bordetella genomosp. 7]|uniref:ABC transporter substrate-binding protein n=1 Tax=Bordetella genomosp. 7 TaxID=1416805 RepID=A0A261QXW2_9BORD|nr:MULTISPECIES: ABC transporter substrate-binding protein [Bordetella]OZI17190.1 ABC transporter substrate-binding protein [Bordetella genomosp. 7]OZI17455.1 ABC transporter substrate-binding protein [Bordetella genomosp. 7]